MCLNILSLKVQKGGCRDVSGSGKWAVQEVERKDDLSAFLADQPFPYFVGAPPFLLGSFTFLLGCFLFVISQRSTNLRLMTSVRHKKIWDYAFHQRALLIYTYDVSSKKSSFFIFCLHLTSHIFVLEHNFFHNYLQTGSGSTLRANPNGAIFKTLRNLEINHLSYFQPK